METVTKENKIVKKVLIIVLEVALIVLGVIFTYATDFKRSLPLGVLLISGGLFAFCLLDFLAILSLSKKEMLSPWKIKKAIGLVITCILTACVMGVSGYDLVKGPQDVVLKETYTTSERNRASEGRIWIDRWKTCIVGKTKEGKSVKIYVEKDEIAKVRNVLLQGKEEVIVCYYKGIRKFYDIKEK